MATNTPQDEFHKTGLRLPRDLHAELHEAALKSGRSYNAEIVNRLQSSFSSLAIPSLTIQQAVDDMIEQTGCTAIEALERLVLAGQSQGGTVLNVRIAPDTTVAQVKAMLNEAFDHVPPDANFIVEREGKTP